MRLDNIPKEFQEALPVLRKIQSAGYEAYFVGGSVRDVLLGKEIHDVDIATSAFPEEVKTLFPRTIDIGIEHGTVMVLADNQQTYEITTFRTESTYQDFRRPDHVEFVRSLEEDLKRRDFTINAFALREDGEVFDLFDGMEDMNNKILRAVRNPHERFREDALRMMRGLRFVSQLGFHFEEETFAAILENHALLGKISVERINVEFTKMLLGAYRKESITTFVETECYEYCPGLRSQGEGLLRFADLPVAPIASESQAWTLLVYCLNLSDAQIGSFLKAWKCSNKLIREVQKLIVGLNFRLQQPWTNKMLYDMAESVPVIEQMLPYFEQENQEEAAVAIYEQLPIHHLRELAINGKDLIEAFDRKGGKWVSDLLALCEAAVLNSELENNKQTLFEFAKAKMAELDL